MRFNSKIIFSLFLFAILLFFAYKTTGTNGNSFANMTEGKNTLNFSYGGFSASQLILINPEIEVIFYYDSIEQRNISYVNAFGGVGRNFQIFPGTIYEIYSKEDSSLEVP